MTTGKAAKLPQTEPHIEPDAPSVTTKTTSSQAAPADMTKCCDCPADIPADAKKCAVCGAEQGPRCGVCAKPIPLKAHRCTACNAYQGRLRRYFGLKDTVLALLIALFAVIGNLVTATSYLLDRESNSAFKVTGADKEFLHLKAWNTGRKPSMLGTCTLRFNDLPIDAVVLDLSDADRAEARNVLTANSPVNLSLTTPELELYRPKGAKYTKTEVVALLSRPDVRQKTATVWIDAEESGHVWNLINPSQFTMHRKDTLPVTAIQTFILGRMIDDH